MWQKCPIMSKPISYGTSWDVYYIECIKEECVWWCRYEGCCGIPLIAENLYAICGEGATKKRPLQEIEELKTRAERAEAKMRKLSEAAAWRDECNAIASWFELPSISTLTDQWDDADAEFANTKSKAEADYQAALKAAMEKKE
ncbi:MAG: hypothetical protein DRP66_10200 [Planctomycetota bacterium]|nr:MAG: hypothetical protein DRP66_10200 [Planctomycetota bacterium]